MRALYSLPGAAGAAPFTVAALSDGDDESGGTGAVFTALVFAEAFALFLAGADAASMVVASDIVNHHPPRHLASLFINKMQNRESDANNTLRKHRGINETQRQLPLHEPRPIYLRSVPWHH